MNFVELILLKPFNALAFLPQAELCRLAGYFVRAQTVLFTSAPVARVRPSICPCVDSESMLLVVFVFTTILSAVLPGVDADAIHIIIDPVSLELASIEPCVGAQAPDLILLPLAIVP